MCSLTKFKTLDTMVYAVCLNQSVADPGFPRGGGANPKGGGRQPIIWPIFPKNCMKMKFWAGGGAPLLRSATAN